MPRPLHPALLKALSAHVFQEDQHPRGEGGRFTAGSGGSGEAPPQRRTLERMPSWHRMANKGPKGFAGDVDHELTVGSWKRYEYTHQIPPGMPEEEHHARLASYTGILNGLRQNVRETAMAPRRRSKQRGKVLIPEGTPRGLITKAYNHGAMAALHELGVIKFDYAADDHLKAELKPLQHFIHYSQRRVRETILQEHPGEWRPYRKAFGKPFKDARTGLDGEVRLRRATIGAHQLIKEAFYRPELRKMDEEEHPRDEHGRWVDRHAYLAGAGATTAAYVAGGAVKDGFQAARGTPGKGKMEAPKHELYGALAEMLGMNIKPPTREQTIADGWRQGEMALAANAGQGHGTFAARVLAGGQRQSTNSIALADELGEARAGMKAGGSAKRLWRGMHGAGAADWMKAKPGESVTIDPHSSWTRDPGVASAYTRFSYTDAGGGAGDKPVNAHTARGKHASQWPNNVAPGVKKVRVHLRGADGLSHLADIEHASSMIGPQAEVMLGRGTKVRIDKIRDSAGGRVVFATAVKQNAKAAFRRGMLRRLVDPAFHLGRGIAGATLGLSVGGLGAYLAHEAGLWGQKPGSAT